MKQPKSLERLSGHELKLVNPYGINVSIFANEQVPIEQTAVSELQEMLELQKTVESFAKESPECFADGPRVEAVALTPDFHKARGIPVGTVLETSGFVVPQAIGNDINCGMRLHLTNLNAEQLVESADQLETACRHLYFEAGRRIPFESVHREALLLNGIRGLCETVDPSFDEGLWSYFHRWSQEKTLARTERNGSLLATSVVGLENFLGGDRLSRDSQIGSIGGGNHFVEFQRVEKILDGKVAHAWNIAEGQVVVMVHTGSVSVGHACGSHYRDKVREIFSATLKHPDNGIFVLPIGEKHHEVTKMFWNGLHNAANFAFANRMFLAAMAWEALERLFGEVEFDLLYDAPHNMLWPGSREGRDTIIHRKGACPARGYDAMQDTEFAYYGEPVLVPGSMGASSYILVGSGFEGTMQSAAHGAGRSISRGSAMKGFEREFEKFLNEFRVVTPLDFRRQDVKSRRDIMERMLKELRQEAPFAYKGIGPVIETIKDAGIARPVAELKPIMTVKG